MMLNYCVIRCQCYQQDPEMGQNHCPKYLQHSGKKPTGSQGRYESTFLSPHFLSLLDEKVLFLNAV